MPKAIAILHFLTQDLPHCTHAQQASRACEAGIRWVQLRVKNCQQTEWLQIARDVKEITDVWHAVLIINDSVTVAKEVDAHGVHLGQQDTSPIEARKILGHEKIIGCSIHSINELAAARSFPVDYFGVGPYRFTTTKQQLDPVLGIEGLRDIVAYARCGKIHQPLIAIGGIGVEDVETILVAGASGLAVSSAINHAIRPELAAGDLLQRIAGAHYNTNMHKIKSQAT